MTNFSLAYNSYYAADARRRQYLEGTASIFRIIGEIS